MAPLASMQQQRLAGACRRVAQPAARCHAGAGPHPSSSTTSTSSQQSGTSRRELLAAAALLPAATAQLAAGRPARAAEASSSAAAEVAAPEWRSFIERDFSFRYPSSLVLVEDLSGQDLDFPTRKVGDNPMKAELRGAAPGAPQRMTVIVKQASSVKQSLLQVTDVSQWGSPREVARLLLVPGAQVLASSSLSVPVPPRDTRTLAGVVARDPITIYRYEMLLPDRSHVAMAVGIQKGNLYVLGAAAPEESWAEAGPELAAVADSFRLIPPR